MDKRIERSIDENTKLSEEFRTLAKTCFGRIFDMLGKRNFERWIDKRNLSSRIKELVIESMQPEEEREHPDWAGYHTRGTNRIRLRKTSKSDVATHEKFHFITDTGEKFPTFINEGLTEYMKGMAEGKPNVYLENVGTVRFLHETFGDSIIKAYLLGQPRVFDNKISLAIVNDNVSERFEGQAKVKSFYRNLDVFQNYSYARSRYEQASLSKEDYTQEELTKMREDMIKAQQAYEPVKDDILGMFEQLAVARISQMAKNLEFYRNGTLDLEFASKTIENMTKLIPIHYFENDFEKSEKLKMQIMKASAREVIKNSHLVVYDKGEEKERKIDTFVEKMLPEVKITKTQVISTPSQLKNDDPILMAENKDVIKKILYLITSDKQLDITSYLERLADLQEKFDIPDSTMEYILTKHNTDRFLNSPSLATINQSIIKSFPLFRTLSKISDEREKDTIESKYRLIGENRYLELRDNQRFFIEIGEDGEIYEEELKYGHSIIFRGRERIEISYKNGMDDFEVSDRHGKIKPHYPISLQELKELEFGKVITKDISEKIKKGNYFTILNDEPNPYPVEGIVYTNEVDTRSRKIDWDGFLQDIQNHQDAVPESVQLDLINKMTSALLDRTYGFGPHKNEHGAYVRDSDIIDIHFEVWDQLEIFFQKDATDQMRDLAKRNLSKFSDKLDDLRKARVSESAKKALFGFENPNAEKEYFKLKDKEEQTIIKKKIQEFPYRDYLEIEENEENLALRLDGVYTTADVDTRNRKFLASKFADGAKVLLNDIPESQRQDSFDLIFSKMMRNAYGIGKKQLEDNKDLQKHFDLIKRNISKNVFLGEELDEESIADSLETFNTFHRNQAESNKKVAAVAFRDDKSRKMYDLIVSLSKGNVSLSDLQGTVKKLVEIHNSPIQDASSKSEKELPEDK